MHYLHKRPDSSLYSFGMRTSAEDLPIAMGKPLVLHFSAFQASRPDLVSTTIGRVIKFSLRTRALEVARFRRDVALAEIAKATEAARVGLHQLQ